MSCYIEELNANQTRYVVVIKRRLSRVLCYVNTAGSCGLAGHGCRSWQEEVNASQEFGRRSLQLYHLPAGRAHREAAIITASGALSHPVSRTVVFINISGIRELGDFYQLLPCHWKVGSQLQGCARGVRFPVVITNVKSWGVEVS